MASRTPARAEAPPYPASLIDRFNSWVETLPLKPSIFYLGLGLGLVLIQVVILWLERGLQATEILPIIVFNGLLTPFVLALIRFLDQRAMRAVRSMRPSLLGVAENRTPFRVKSGPGTRLTEGPPCVPGLPCARFSRS